MIKKNANRLQGLQVALKSLEDSFEATVIHQLMGLYNSCKEAINLCSLNELLLRAASKDFMAWINGVETTNSLEYCHSENIKRQHAQQMMKKDTFSFVPMKEYHVTANIKPTLDQRKRLFLDYRQPPVRPIFKSNGKYT